MFKFEYLENSLADFSDFDLILQDFEYGLSDEINLFWHCSFPLIVRSAQAIDNCPSQIAMMYYLEWIHCF